jgi:hypothetical protein
MEFASQNLSNEPEWGNESKVKNAENDVNEQN